MLRASRENAQKLGEKEKGKRNTTLQYRDQVLNHNPLRVLEHILLFCTAYFLIIYYFIPKAYAKSTCHRWITQMRNDSYKVWQITRSQDRKSWFPQRAVLSEPSPWVCSVTSVNEAISLPALGQGSHGAWLKMRKVCIWTWLCHFLAAAPICCRSSVNFWSTSQGHCK